MRASYVAGGLDFKAVFANFFHIIFFRGRGSGTAFTVKNGASDGTAGIKNQAKGILFIG